MQAYTKPEINAYIQKKRIQNIIKLYNLINEELTYAYSIERYLQPEKSLAHNLHLTI